MVEGFLKGIWGKPATNATGILGLWGTVTSTPSKLVDKITSPFKFIMAISVVGLGFLLYSRYKK